jgi:hypothetical protein
MPPPRKSLFERCRAGSFRARHHWRLLADAPDLPVPELAALQARARDSSEQEQRTLARAFAQQVRGLTGVQREQLDFYERFRASDPGNKDEGLPAEPGQAWDRPSEHEPELLGELEAALSELDTRVRLDFTAGERFRASLLRRGVKQLAAIEAQIEQEGLTVTGSRGQARPHPLLAQAAALHRDLDNRYRRFELDVGLRAQFDRAQAISRGQRTAGAGAHGTRDVRTNDATCASTETEPPIELDLELLRTWRDAMVQSPRESAAQRPAATPPGDDGRPPRT